MKPYTFTLAKLRQELEHVCPAKGYRAPSMIGLKKWSAGGLFAPGCRLDQAVTSVLSKMQENESFYVLKRSDGTQVAPNKTQTACQPLERGHATGQVTPAPCPADRDVGCGDAVATTGRSVPPLTTGPESAPVPAGLTDLMRGLMDQMGDVTQRLERLERRLQQTSSPTSPGPDPGLAQVVAVVQQLDDLRKHMMVRMDAELQVMRAQAQSQKVAPVPAVEAHVSALDAQRHAARVAREMNRQREALWLAENGNSHYE